MEKEKMISLVEQIREMIISNEREDGTFSFDVWRVNIALEFVILEIEKTKENC